MQTFLLFISILTITLAQREADDKHNNANYQGHGGENSQGGSNLDDDEHAYCEETVDWAMNTRGTHYKPSWINRRNAVNLQHLWQFRGCGAITANPAVLSWGVCWSDYGSCFQCVTHNGTLIY